MPPAEALRVSAAITTIDSSQAPNIATPTDRRTEARYALKSGLELIATANGGLLLSLRPLLALRLNPQAFALLSQLAEVGEPSALAARVPGLTPADIATFLDGLTRRRFLTRTPPVPAQWPTVSIIIPARNRPAATRACVASLLALDYPHDRLEIIVVDDASEPPLALSDLPVRVLRQEHNIGQSAARNLAAGAARGQLLAFIDNDCEAAADWLTALVPYFSDPAIGIVGGRVLAPPPNGPVAAFEAVRSPLDMGTVSGEVGPGEVIAYLPTCNLLTRRDGLLTQGGFNATLRVGEDVDFIWRTLASGARACYAPEGRIVHHHRDRLGALLRRRADYGSSEAELDLRHPEGRRVMPVPVVSLTLLAALAFLGIWQPLSAALILTALAGVGVEIFSKQRQLRQTGARLPPAKLVKAVLREHGASLYHLSANVIRYYSLPLLVIGLIELNLLPAIMLLLLIAPVSDYRRLRPALSAPMFIGLYWLEMAAYQIGVWRGCWRRRTLQPLLPKIRLRR